MHSEMFDTQICDFDHQYEHLPMRLLILLMIRFVLIRLWQVSLLVRDLVEIDEALSVSCWIVIL